MRNKRVLAVHILITAGAVLIIAAMVIALYNGFEAQRAEESASSVVPLIEDKIAENTVSMSDVPMPSSSEMTVSEIDGFGYIGCLSLPSLGLKLPVMSEYTEYQLKLAPCRQQGSLSEGNMVIAGHNYRKHFGTLGKLKINDIVSFTDMDGRTYLYKAAELYTVPPSEGEAVLESDMPLVLYTCTYSGRERLAAGCMLLTPDEISALADN